MQMSRDMITLKSFPMFIYKINSVLSPRRQYHRA
uniref:Uncharacterized protein n=1 Tax=Arundo donax TaxID=35708 RepID=A0A0A9CHF6_ARUDO